MGDLEDFQRFGDRLQFELDQIDEHHPRDQEYVERWVRYEDARVKESTLSVYLQNARTAAREWDDGPLVELDENDFEALGYHLRHHADNPNASSPGLADSTAHNVLVAVRKLLQHADHDGLEWIDGYELSAPETESVRPEDMLRPDDIARLREGANNYRDIAMIEFLADTGVRLSLMGSLRVCDVDLDGPKPTFRPNPNADGLKGATVTDYPLIDSPATLRTFLRDIHPRPDRDDVAFFHKLPGNGIVIDEDDDGSITPTVVRRQLRKAASKGGVDKPVNPHNFRHSAVSRMVREGYTRSQIEHRVHWDVDSDMWQVYEHIEGEQHTDDIFEHAGVVEPDGESASAERRPCGNCNEPLPPHLDFCPGCFSAASADGRRALREAISSLAKVLAATDDPQKADMLTEAIDGLQEDARPLGNVDLHEDSSSSSRD